MRTLMTSMWLTLAGCSPGPALKLLEEISSEDRTRAADLLAADARFVTADQTFLGRDEVRAALEALPAGGRVSGHHDVAQLVQPNAVLFAHGADAVHSLALPEGEGSDEPPAALVDYVAAWNEPEASARELLLSGFAAGGRYVDPTVDAVGRDALAAHITAFRVSQPGTTFERTSAVRQAREWLLFEWAMHTGGRTTPGTDIVRLDDEGRVALVAGFL